MNETVDIYDSIKHLAEQVSALYTMDFIINISGIGTPTVLLTDAGFDTLFPIGCNGELMQNDDGETWLKREVEADNVRWVNWKRVEV